LKQFRQLSDVRAASRRSWSEDGAAASGAASMQPLLDQPQPAGDKVENNSAEYHGADHCCYSQQGLPERFA
jgi:hypothetical protein